MASSPCQEPFTFARTGATACSLRTLPSGIAQARFTSSVNSGISTCVFDRCAAPNARTIAASCPETRNISPEA